MSPFPAWGGLVTFSTAPPSVLSCSSSFPTLPLYSPVTSQASHSARLLLPSHAHQNRTCRTGQVGQKEHLTAVSHFFPESNLNHDQVGESWRILPRTHTCLNPLLGFPNLITIVTIRNILKYSASISNCCKVAAFSLFTIICNDSCVTFIAEKCNRFPMPTQFYTTKLT